jgi:S1-C subfamily serine protease
MSGTIRRLVVVAVAIAALSASVSSACAQTPPRTVPSTPDLSAAIEGSARLVGASVVEIFTTSYRPGEGVIPGTADLVMTQRGSGSGVIVDPAGYIVTNAHVVRGAQRLRIELPSAARFSLTAAAPSAVRLSGSISRRILRSSKLRRRTYRRWGLETPRN